MLKLFYINRKWVLLLHNREKKHKNKEHLCYCCDTLQQDTTKIKKYTISNRGYGSIFDMSRFTVQFCEKCDKEEYSIWFEEKGIISGDYIEYVYETQVKNLINSFIVENQEYVWNNMNDGYYMERQDWIDMENGVLPDEKYEEYGMYSPRQIKTYEERFSTCEHPINVISKTSKSSLCPVGAYGDYDQKPGYNISERCFSCQHYKKRETTIKEMSYEDYEKYKIYYKSKLNYFKLKDLFE